MTRRHSRTPLRFRLMNAPPRMRLSSARLAALFVVIFAAAITLVLTAVYVLTARVLDREVDSVIRSEVTHLVDDYSSGGLLQLVATLHRRADSWDRTGAVYLLIQPNGYPIAGNLAHWPHVVRHATATGSNSRSMRSEAGGVVSHPVRAQVFLLPGGRRLLVGTDILERRKLASRLRTAMFWGAGSSVLLATIFGLTYSRRIRRRVSAIRDHLRVDHGRRPVATPARGKIARRVRRAGHGRQSHAGNASSSRPTCCARRSTARRTTCAVLSIVRVCASKSRCNTKA